MPTTSGREFVLLMSSPGGYTFSKVLPEEKSSKGVRENRIAQPTITILFLITHIDLSQLLISIYAQGDAERGGMVWQFFFSCGDKTIQCNLSGGGCWREPLWQGLHATLALLAVPVEHS